MATQAGGGTAASRDNLALGLGIGATVSWLVGMVVATDDGPYDWVWFVMAALGLGALVTGLMAGRGKPRGRALIGTILGAVFVLMFLAFALGIVE